ncbi:AAA family ATPase [Microcoleus sp. S28C3]|uniref:AAA family ATPase n=1 Tax=Microcoleus sp. S28C3 TaxID=3055414 RepID=UPI002FD55AE0
MNNSEKTTDIQTNIQILDYQIIERVYSGSRTLVYRAVRTSDQLPVVIKLLKNDYPTFSELVQFRNQYTIAKNLNSPLIIQTYSLSPYHNGYALVMEDFGGISLQEWGVKRKNLPSLREFLEMAIALCNTLDILYRERIIHKDIKPSNILINPETKQVKLIDFSIASLLPRETQTLINPNVLEGTLAYISPEQTGRMNRGIDYRTDFYSLGVTLYELLTGKLPFQSHDLMELVHGHIAKAAPLVQEINPQIPSVLSDIVNKLMAKNAESRYQSALGLKYDLEKCLDRLQETGRIESFEIAQRDVCDRFLIPDKLYGRETEVKALLQAFERVSQGATEMMLVAGFSGIGKTAVVNEVHKPIVRQRGYFIKGKYDQFQRNIPLSAFVQAFRDLMGQLLTESEAQIQEWKNKILSAVGENGQVIIEVIPELSRIIGQQPPTPELSGTAAQNRFNLLFQKFTKVFASAEHPLVIFLDDLQWADSASLNLMQILMADTSHLFIIGAYRDNEVNPGHPLMLTLGEMQKTLFTINTITLTPLSQLQVNQLVADTLKCSAKLALPLTQLVFQKTQGNPFFTTQFLKALYQDGFIQFDFELGAWQCDIAQVRRQALTSDVVEFMALQLQKLPAETQEVLKLAACIGNQFDLTTLGIVWEHSEVETAASLWKALQEWLVLPISDIYKFYVGEKTQAVSQENQETVAYKFLHDRVQQASYSLIPSDQKQATHLKIGQLLQQSLSEMEKEEKLFDIVGHLNLGIELMTQPSDRQALAQLNLQAGVKARNSTAYAAARVYLQTGIELLTANCWQHQYELTLNLYVASAEVAYLNGDFEEMEQMAALVLRSAQTILDRVKIYQIQISALTAQSQMLEAISVGKNALVELGVEFSSEPDEALTGKALQTLGDRLQGKQISELINLPAMSDSETIAAMQLLAMLFSAIFAGSPALLPLYCSTMVSLSLQFGNAPASTIGYVGYGMVLSSFLGEVKTGYDFGRLALSLVNELNVREFKSSALLFFGAFLQHRQETLRSAILTLKDSYLAGMETGDFLNAGYSIAICFYDHLFGGVALDDWALEIENYCVVLATLKQDSPLAYLKATQQTVQNLTEVVKQPDLLIGTAYDETVMFPKQYQNNELTVLAVVYIYKLMLAYIFGNYTNALDYLTQANRYLMAATGMIQIPVFHFYAGLTYLALCSMESEIEQANTLVLMEIHQTNITQWAHHAPMNHQHKVDLIEAEKCRVLGQRAEAIELYDKAIAGAKANEYLQEEALANELAAKFYINWDKEKIAQIYMQEAYYCYIRWGAKAKVADLEKCYPQLLAPILQQTRSPLSPHETLFTLGSVTSTCSPISSSSSVSTALDLAAILKASQTISGEIELSKLLSSLLSIVIENAGADRCVLMLLRDERLLIEGSIIVGTEPVVLQGLPIEDSQDIPLKLIYKVKHERQTVVLLDATADPTLANDPYIIRQQPHSILCSPILHQGKLMGILYLENTLVRGAFTSDRVELLNLLCTQAAISLENARLYRNSQNYAQELTQSLAKLQATETRFQNLANNIPGMVYQFRLEPDSSISTPYVSSGCLDLYEVEPELVMTGKFSLYDLHHPDDNSAIGKAIAYSAQNLTPFEQEWRIILPSGTVKWIQSAARPERLADGSILWDGVVIDISDRKHIEAEQTRLLAILESTSDLIGTADPTGRNLYLNRAWRNLLGLEHEALAKGTEISKYHPEWALEIIGNQGLPEAIRSGIWMGETAVFDGHGGEIPVSQVVLAHKSSDGELQYFSTIMRDISDRKQAESAILQKSQELQQALQSLQQAQLQIVQSEKMSALGNLVAGVAHEINNPVGFIWGNLNEAKRTVQDLVEHLNLYGDRAPEIEIADHAEDIDLDYIIEDLPKMIDSMQLGCDRIKDISTTLCTFSRADKDYKVPFNIHSGLDSTILILKYRLKANDERPAIEVVKDYGNIPEIECFPGQLNQVFMNIFANAIDALEESNTGRSFAEIKANPNRITIQTSLVDNGVKISITDNGRGMNESVKQKIFDHLFTTKAVGKGTGLGLAIARQIVVEKHSGSLQVNSIMGTETEFIVTLPTHT